MSTGGCLILRLSCVSFLQVIKSAFSLRRLREPVFPCFNRLMNIYLEFKEKIRIILNEMHVEGIIPSHSLHTDFRVEPARDERHGDIVCNVAMVFSRVAGIKPRELAVLFLSGLENDPVIERIDIAGHGFLNLHLKDEFWPGFLERFLEQSEEVGCSASADKGTVSIHNPFDLASAQSDLFGFRAFHHSQAMINIFRAAGYRVKTVAYDSRDNEGMDRLLYLDFCDPELNQDIRYGYVQLMSGETAIEMPENMPDAFYDSLCFMILGVKNGADIEIDIDKVVEQSSENPHFYVQYTHAQIFSVFRNTHHQLSEIGKKNQKIININLQDHDLKKEIGLLKKIAEFHWHVHRASVTYETHCVAIFLYGLARDFHAIWSPGKEVPQLRFNNEDEREYDVVHFALLKAVSIVLNSGLKILGVKPITEMR